MYLFLISFSVKTQRQKFKKKKKTTIVELVPKKYDQMFWGTVTAVKNCDNFYFLVIFEALFFFCRSW